jgi:lipopolysaccharide transport system permease protein
MSTIVLSPGGSRGLTAEVARLAGYRDLLLLLVQKDLKAKYKGTALGFFWSFLNPLLLMIVYAVVFSVIARVSLQRYPVFLLCGMLPWNAFTIAISTGSQTIVGNANLIRRVNFPREFLPLASVVSSIVNMLLSLGILLGFAVGFRQPLGLPLLTLPLLIALQLILTTGICLLVSALMVYFRDLENIITLVLTVLFFVTPIIYPLSSVGHGGLRGLLQLNPIQWLIGSYQDLWYWNSWPDLHRVLGFAAVSMVALALGWFFFRRLEGDFAEEV